MSLQKRTGDDTQSCPRLFVSKDSNRGWREVGLAATLAAQLDSKGEWESGLTCLPVEGTSVVSFRNLSCTIGSSKEGERPLISL